MRVLLIDIDSKIPNLALMKLSAYHKKQGDTVFLNDYLCRPDKVMISCIFKENQHRIAKLPFLGAICGGTGTEDWGTTLPPDIEYIYPDYGLYRTKYAMGFTSRGCPRACGFCVVPQKEGGIQEWAHPSEFWKGQKELILLDPNFLASPLSISKLKWLIKQKVKVDFNQGLDLRLVNNDVAFYLSKVKYIKRVRFAWDRIKDEGLIEKGIKSATKYIKASSIMIYVLVGYDTTFEEDMHRAMRIRSWGCDPFIMRYHKRSKLLNEFSRWINVYQMRKIRFPVFLRARGYSFPQLLASSTAPGAPPLY